MFRVRDYAERKLPIQCVAHRGFSGRFPENTLLAFRKAVEVGADLVECDVRPTKDGALVVFHDEDLRRMAGRSERVEEVKLSELRKLDLGMGQTVPTFEEVLEVVGGRVGMNIHVQRPGELVDRVVDMCREAGVVDSAFLAIAWEDEIRRVRSLYPEVWVCSLYRQGEPGLVDVNIPLSVRLLQPGRGVVNRELVERAHGAGMVMGVFYGNTYSDIMWLSRLGVDGILTDFPDVFLEALR